MELAVIKEVKRGAVSLPRVSAEAVCPPDPLYLSFHAHIWFQGSLCSSASGHELCCQTSLSLRVLYITHLTPSTAAKSGEELPAAHWPVGGWAAERGGGERSDEERWRAGQRQNKAYVHKHRHTSREREAVLLQHTVSGSQVVWQAVIFFSSAGRGLLLLPPAAVRIRERGARSGFIILTHL